MLACQRDCHRTQVTREHPNIPPQALDGHESHTAADLEQQTPASLGCLAFDALHDPRILVRRHPWPHMVEILRGSRPDLGVLEVLVAKWMGVPIIAYGVD